MICMVPQMERLELRVLEGFWKESANLEHLMQRRMCVICLWLITLPAFSQSAAKYQVGTITAVNPHQAQDDTGADIVRYDVSVRVGDAIYVVLYTPPLGTSPVKYAAGRNVLVLIGDKTVRYNDIAGQSLEVPIISRKSADNAKQGK